MPRMGYSKEATHELEHLLWWFEEEGSSAATINRAVLPLPPSQPTHPPQHYDHPDRIEGLSIEGMGAWLCV